MFFALSFLSETQETVLVLGRWCTEEEEEEAKEALGALGGETLNLDRFAVDPEGMGREAAWEGM